jgi:hypothetical protein
MTTYRMISTFDIRATAASLGKPDELAIDWTALPTPSCASVYLPPVDANDVVTKAEKMYGAPTFSAIDHHTVACVARGISYLPIPAAGGNLAGLIDVELPDSAVVGRKYGINVRQLTTAYGEIRGTVNRDPLFGVSDFALRERPLPIAWRKVLGEFQIALNIVEKGESRRLTERNYSLLRWIFEGIPAKDRWYPVFARYIGILAVQITALGGDPSRIRPSPSGVWNDAYRPPQEHCCGVVGKIEGLIFDHFGDFEGFILKTEDDCRIHFYSREGPLKRVVERAWSERLRVTVIPEDKDERHPRRIILHPTPHAS